MNHIRNEKDIDEAIEELLKIGWMKCLGYSEDGELIYQLTALGRANVDWGFPNRGKKTDAEPKHET